jgi:predicted acylesterase/phospholipase RssA
MSERDVAIVLSGGGMNGVLLELGFLQRLRVSSLWPRVGRIYGTSAGALTGTMAALDLLDELEEFVLGLQPGDIFRPQSLWRLPLNGLHEYALPATVGERMIEPLELGERLCKAPIEVVIFATDVSDEDETDRAHSYELVYSSHETPPEVLAQAVLASAAISALVLPLTVGDRIATDGGWVRNFPLGAALDQPDVNLVVAFRYVPRYPHIGIASLARVRRRLHRFRGVPPVRAFIAELDEAEARELRGEPVHLGDMLIRLMRVAIQRNTALEEQLADQRDAAIKELQTLRGDVTRIVAQHARPGRRGRAARAVEERFAQTALPRLVPRITVRGSGGAESLEAGFRSQREWSEDSKRALIARGYAAADAELAAYGIDLVEQAV